MLDSNSTPPISDKKFASLFLWVGCLFLAGLGLTTPNPFETALACLSFPILFTWLWRPPEPPVLLFAATFQLFQVVTPIFSANLGGENISQGADPQMTTAFYVGMISIGLLAFGMKVCSAGLDSNYFQQLEASTQQINVQRLAISYGIFLVATPFLTADARAVSGLTQFILALASLKLAVIFLIIWLGFRNPRFKVLAIVVSLVEVITGISGFFSDFKTILFIILVLYFAKSSKLSKLIRPQIIFLASVSLMIMIYWQGIKADYRDFVNLGSSTQSVQVSLLERLSFHAETIRNIKPETIDKGFESGLERLGYLRFLGLAIDYVPNNIPHQEGKLWVEAFTNLVPRFFYPDKPIIDDSVRTSQYTGYFARGAEYGTSISMGYVAESYVDFGIPLMFLPIFGLGCFWGWLYRFLAQSGSVSAFAYPLAATLILESAILFEASNVKFIAGAISATLVYLIIINYYGRSGWRWLAPNHDR